MRGPVMVTSSCTRPRRRVVMAGVFASHMLVSQTKATSQDSSFLLAFRKGTSDGEPDSSSPSMRKVALIGSDAGRRDPGARRLDEGHELSLVVRSAAAIQAFDAILHPCGAAARRAGSSTARADPQAVRHSARRTGHAASSHSHPWACSAPRPSGARVSAWPSHRNPWTKGRRRWPRRPCRSRRHGPDRSRSRGCGRGRRAVRGSGRSPSRRRRGWDEGRSWIVPQANSEMMRAQLRMPL